MDIGEQLTKQYQSLSIPGVDTAKGIALAGGSLDTYKQLLDKFCEDAEKRLPLLQSVPEADALSAFVTQVHSLKSLSASIGAAELSTMAGGLEAAGWAGDIVFIQENLRVFIENLVKLMGGIRAWGKTMKDPYHD